MQYDPHNGAWGTETSPPGPYPHQAPGHPPTNTYHSNHVLGRESLPQPTQVSSQYAPQNMPGMYLPPVSVGRRAPPQWLPEFDHRPPQTSDEHRPHASILRSQQPRYPSQTADQHSSYASGPYPQQSHVPNQRPSHPSDEYHPHSTLHPQQQHHSSHQRSSYASVPYPQQSHSLNQRPPALSGDQGWGPYPQQPRESHLHPSQMAGHPDSYGPAGPSQQLRAPNPQSSHTQPRQHPAQVPVPAVPPYPFQPQWMYSEQPLPSRTYDAHERRPFQNSSRPSGYQPYGDGGTYDFSSGAPPNLVPTRDPTAETHLHPASNLSQAKNVRSTGTPQPAAPAGRHPPANTSTTATPSDATSSAMNNVSQTRSSTLEHSHEQTEAAASELEAQFVPPLDMGPHATYADVLSVWEKLSPEDHEIADQIRLEKQNEIDNRMDAESPRLFTVGSSQPKAPAKKPAKPRRKPTTSRCPPTAARMANGPNHSTTVPSTDPSNAPRRHPFKSPWVEDYESDSDDDESDDDVVPIPSHLKGKGRAADEEQGSSPAVEHQTPALNVRPVLPPRQPNQASPFSAVLNAFHQMGERFERLETSVAQGLKHMDDKISDIASDPPSMKAPQNPFGHRVKGPKGAVAKLIATRNENNKIPPRAPLPRNLPTGCARPSSASMPSSKPVPPYSGASKHPPPSTHPYGHQHSQYPTSTRVPPTSHTEYSGAWCQGAQAPTMAPRVPPGYGGYTGQQHAPPRTSTQAPHVGSTAAPIPSQTDEDLSAEDVGEIEKLYRKYVRRHLWQELLRIEGSSELLARCPPLTDEEYAQYMRVKERVINADNFRIDFTRGWGKCTWNAEARNFFAHHFVLSVRGGMYQNPPLPVDWVTETMAAQVFDKIMPHVTRLYNDHSKAPTMQRQAKELRDQERKRADTRRGTLLRWRLETLVKLRLDHHLVLFADLEAAHLSSDEPAFGFDDRQSQFKLFYIIEAAWQSSQFKKFVRDLDQWYIYHSRPKVGVKQRGGNRPRIREELPKGKARVVDSIAPRGLWRNCYDEDWVKNLKVSEREDLNMLDEDYDFTLPSPPPIPTECLPRRATASSSNTDNSKRGGAFTNPNTLPSLMFTFTSPTAASNDNSSNPTAAPATSLGAQAGPVPGVSSIVGSAPAQPVPSNL